MMSVELDFYSSSSLKQQSAGRHVVPFRHIILISSQAVNTNLVVFCLTRSELEPTFHHTLGKQTNHYTTNMVPSCRGGGRSSQIFYKQVMKWSFMYTWVSISSYLNIQTLVFFDLLNNVSKTRIYYIILI